MKLSATILTFNSAKRLEAVLNALDFCDDIVILDSGSSDNTLLIAAKFANVSIYKHEGEFLGFGKMHQKATAFAKNSWILSIDSDEIVSTELKDEILAANLDEKTVYAIGSKNFYKEEWIYSCGWYPDYKLRLFNKSITDFNDRMVHENIVTNGLKIVKLTSHLYHYSYNNYSEFIAKMQKYSDYYAKENCGKKTSTPLKATLHAF
ncbi:MAG: hypothetical protein RL154_1007, partial [Pseudomonadota bacterium]